MYSCCCSFEWLSLSYGSKNTPVGQKDAEEIAKAVLLYVFRIAFPASPFAFNSSLTIFPLNKPTFPESHSTWYKFNWIQPHFQHTFASTDICTSFNNFVRFLNCFMYMLLNILLGLTYFSRFDILWHHWIYLPYSLAHNTVVGTTSYKTKPFHKVSRKDLLGETLETFAFVSTVHFCHFVNGTLHCILYTIHKTLPYSVDFFSVRYFF